MWQIYAMMAKDQIDEQLQQAEQRRQSALVPHEPRRHRRLHLPAMHRHAVRSSSRAG